MWTTRNKPIDNGNAQQTRSLINGNLQTIDEAKMLVDDGGVGERLVKVERWRGELQTWGVEGLKEEEEDGKLVFLFFIS